MILFGLVYLLRAMLPGLCQLKSTSLKYCAFVFMWVTLPASVQAQTPQPRIQFGSIGTVGHGFAIRTDGRSFVPTLDETIEAQA